MNLGVFYIPIITIIFVILIIKILENYISDVFAPNKIRETGLYQGGENIKSKINRYRAENFDLTMFFMILHVIGFIGASIFVLDTYDINPINWTTMGFGVIIFYTALIIRFSKGVKLS